MVKDFVDLFVIFFIVHLGDKAFTYSKACSKETQSDACIIFVLSPC